MANIPIRDKQIPPHVRPNQIPQQVPGQRPAAPYNRPAQYPPHGMPQYMQQSASRQRPQQMPRVNPALGNIRPNGYQGRPVPPRASTEQLRPIKNSQRSTSPTKKPKGKSKQKKDYTKIKDFLLAFTVSLVLFGIAAIIVCNALISLFA